MIKIYNKFNVSKLMKEFDLETRTEADLRGADLNSDNLIDANLTRAAIIVYGLAWPVYVTKNSVCIGCKSYNLEKWKNFSDDEISNRHDNA